MSMGISKYLLPFAVQAPERRRRASRELVLGAVFAISESERGKSGGLILKKPPEEILFISEVYYPIWIFPWKNRILLFDGFGVKKHRIMYDIIPDTSVFLKEMELSSKRIETYLDFLQRNLNFFSSFSGKGEKIVEGLITDPEFTGDFISYMKSSERIKSSMVNKLVLAPRINIERAKEIIGEISDFIEILDAEAKKLRNVMRILTSETERYIGMLISESKRVKLTADKKISEVKSKFEKKIEILRKKYDKMIIKISNDVKEKTQNLEKEKIDLQLRKEKLRNYIERCEDEISRYRLLKDEEKVNFWKLENKSSKKKISEINKKIKEVDAKIMELENLRANRINEVKSEYKSKFNELNTEIERIKSERDEKLIRNEEIIKKLRELTSKIVSQINDLMESRLPRSRDILQLGLPIIRRKPALIYIPFYLTCYRRDSKRRYMVLPPSLMCSYGASVRIRSAFGARKIRMIFRERSRSISILINQFIDIVKSDPLLDGTIREAGVKTNLLVSRRNRRVISEGLTELYGEGWISKSELEYLNDKLSCFNT